MRGGRNALGETFRLLLDLIFRISFTCGLSQPALPLHLSPGLPDAFPNRRSLMDFRRKMLPHDLPDWLDPSQEAFFITINCLQRQHNQLALPEVWKQLIESIEFRENRGEWKWKLVLAMPDHLHGIVVFPNSFFMKKSIASWKRWLAKENGICWQRDFFDHRLRSAESAVEKANYIWNNPVRAGLVESAEEWPFVR